MQCAQIWCHPTFCVSANLDPVIVDNWEQGVIFDEVGQKGIRILGDLKNL